MKEEINAAVSFIIRLIGKNNENLSDELRANLELKLYNILTERFRDHWFPDKPYKGQGYRCIRVNENDRRDPALELACRQMGINFEDLKLPVELTIWVDPEEVACRFGEHKGSYCILAKFKDGNQENFIDQINIEELEQKSIERAKQASYDLVNSRKKKNLKNSYLKSNGYNNGSLNYGRNDYNNGLVISTSNYNYYGSNPKFGVYRSSPPNHHNGSNLNGHHVHNLFSSTFLPISPPSRSNASTGNVNGTPNSYNRGPSNYGHSGSPGPFLVNNTPTSARYQDLDNINNGSSNNNSNNNKFSRGLHSAFNNATNITNAFGSYNSQTNDRFHWMSKSIVKA